MKNNIVMINREPAALNGICMTNTIVFAEIFRLLPQCVVVGFYQYIGSIMH
jgi:hypothetical protein